MSKKYTVEQPERRQKLILLRDTYCKDQLVT